MQASDRGEFLTELGKLCAGFCVPLTKAREEAYWAGLQKMSMRQFRHCVEHALGPDYDGDEMPTTRQLWRIARGSAAQAKPAAQAAIDDPDHLEYFANRLLWLHVSHRGGLGSTGRFVPAYGMTDCNASEELTRCLKFKRELVAEFVGYVREGEELATRSTFVRWWLAGLEHVSEVLARTRRDLEHLAAAPESQVRIPQFMARELPQRTRESA